MSEEDVFAELISEFPEWGDGGEGGGEGVGGDVPFGGVPYGEESGGGELGPVLLAPPSGAVRWLAAGVVVLACCAVWWLPTSFVRGEVSSAVSVARGESQGGGSGPSTTFVTIDYRPGRDGSELFLRPVVTTTTSVVTAATVVASPTAVVVAQAGPAPAPRGPLHCRLATPSIDSGRC